MILNRLKYAVVREFSKSKKSKLQAVKLGVRRDVVTQLDMELHNAAEEFVESLLPTVQLLSEEGVPRKPNSSHSLLVVDPLDGSNNFHLGLPGYGFMAALVTELKIVEASVVIPQESTYLDWDARGLISSQPLRLEGASESSPIYIAYPPDLDDSGRALRSGLLDSIDNISSGAYRSGSACIGLFQLLRGQHKAFVGLSLRVWDFIAFLPMLTSQGIEILYSLEGNRGTILASWEIEVLDYLAKSLLVPGRVQLSRYRNGEALRWDFQALS